MAVIYMKLSVFQLQWIANIYWVNVRHCYKCFTYYVYDLSLPAILWIGSNMSPPNGFVEKSMKGEGGQVWKQEHIGLMIVLRVSNIFILLQAFTWESEEIIDQERREWS